jgi:hypothetical protein
MEIFHMFHPAKSPGAAARGRHRLPAGIRSAYQAIVPRSVRRRAHKLRAFVFGHARYRFFAEEDRPRRDFIRRAFNLLAENGISGDYVEFGCASGKTFGHAYRFARSVGHSARLWAFDSFEGYPRSDDPRDRHPLWFEGGFRTSVQDFLEICQAHGIPRDRFEIVKGYYSETLRPAAPERDRLPGAIAFCYVDCDLYTSTAAVLEFLAPRLQHGMVIAFGGYFAHAATAVAGERLAFLEFRKVVPEFSFLPYIQYGTTGQSFLVESRALLGDAARDDPDQGSTAADLRRGEAA